MHTRLQRFLLILVAIALATSPLRGAYALPVTGVTGDTGHCAHHQDGMPAMDHAAGMPDTGSGGAVHDCDRGCNGDCCDGACGSCAHAAIALPGTLVTAVDRYSDILAPPVIREFAGRTVHPPFRPPIILS